MSKPDYEEIARIFSIEHYKSHEDGEDEFSKESFYFYKFGNKKDKFVEKLVELYNLRFKDDSFKFDFVSLYPTRKKDGLNDNMVSLVKDFCEKTELEYKQIIKRNRTIKPSHELKTFSERIENLKDSLDIIEDIKDKNILLIDNNAITGISLVDATNFLLINGAKEVVCMTLGIGYKGRESDWDDLNHTLKYSKIKNICKTPFVPKEKREEWKKTQ
ncbi:MAG: hypothetical protein KKF89_00040 [Nanoarchaeota archaeon]|nr:hypothetical protein [Nanoarchaeota archaeon]